MNVVATDIFAIRKALAEQGWIKQPSRTDERYMRPSTGGWLYIRTNDLQMRMNPLGNKKQAAFLCHEYKLELIAQGKTGQPHRHCGYCNKLSLDSEWVGWTANDWAHCPYCGGV